MTRHSAMLIAVAGLVMSAGCGRPVHPTASADTPPPSPSCPAVTTVTEADSGRTYCLDRSTRVEVYLHGTAQDRWSPIRLAGAALRRTTSGKGMLALGVTGGFFVADRAGTAHLTAARRPCDRLGPVGNCRAPRAFDVTVVVR